MIRMTSRSVCATICRSQRHGRDRADQRTPGRIRRARPLSWREAQSLEDLEAQGCCRHQEHYAHAVGKCDRCKTVVEPRLSTQWFIKIQPLADKAIARGRDKATSVHAGEIQQDLLRVDAEHSRLVHLAPVVVGASHSGVALRQVRRDHRRARDSREAAQHVRPREITQETDVLDTWFSSGLLPFTSWMAATEATQDLEAFYPTRCSSPASTFCSSGWRA